MLNKKIMEYTNIHIIDEEMYNNLLDMIYSKDINNRELAIEIIFNADTNDLMTCHYIEEICLTTIMTQPKSPINDFYIHLRNQPNWKIVQQNYLAFQDDMFGLPIED
jgi:homospermidine synthase